MATYHGIHIPDVRKPQVVEGLDHFFFRRYYTRRDTPAAGAAVWAVGVAGEADGWVSVYDQGENFRRANAIAKALSAFLHKPALWLGLFEDLDFYYQLFSEGEAIDGYDSDPSIYDPEEGYTDDPEGAGWLPVDLSGVNKDRNLAGLGSPAAVLSILSPAVEGAEAKLQSLLSRGRAWHGPDEPPSPELAWAEEGVGALAELFGLDPKRAATGFDALVDVPKPPRWLTMLEYHKLSRPAANHRRGPEQEL